jgi:hypothetical protein
MKIKLADETHPTEDWAAFYERLLEAMTKSGALDAEFKLEEDVASLLKWNTVL